MAAKTTTKDWLFNFAYSFGAAIVIIGAWMKITHTSIGPIGGNLMLTIGLLTEAFIFILSAFDAPMGDYAWEKAYPELMDGEAAPAKKKDKQEIKQAEASLSAKLDDMLKEAKLDSDLFERLRQGISSFGDSVQQINKTTDAAASTQQYGDQLALAANHMESLNALYQVQLENGKKQVELNKRFIDDMEKSAGGTEKFVTELQSLTENINNLNKVYGGMLSAMKG